MTLSLFLLIVLQGLVVVAVVVVVVVFNSTRSSEVSTAKRGHAVCAAAALHDFLSPVKTLCSVNCLQS